MNNIIILLGPTASGKSKISYLLANDFDFEIINADLFSIYKYLNIGTAKPSNEKFKTYKHYLFNKLEPNETYNVSSYCADVLNAIDNIIKRRKIQSEYEYITPLVLETSSSNTIQQKPYSWPWDSLFN